MHERQLTELLSKRILNVLKDSGETRIDKASQAIAKYLVESGTVTEDSMFDLLPSESEK